METQEGLRHQLDSLADLQSIVRTMKALAASSIHEYEQAVAALRRYDEALRLGFAAALRDAPAGAWRVSSHPAEPTRAVAVVFGSDHGLCGRFNEMIADHLLAGLEQWPASAGAKRRLLVVGHRLAPLLAERGVTIDDALGLPGTVDQIAVTIQLIIQRIDDWTPASGGAALRVFHNRPGPQLSAEPVTRTLLPLDLGAVQHLGQREWPGRRLPRAFMHEPELFSTLVRQHLFMRLFRACAASQASEQASRLAAMQRAESSLEDRVASVTARFRRLRQDAITAELLEVVSGFEAVAAAQHAHQGEDSTRRDLGTPRGD